MSAYRAWFQCRLPIKIQARASSSIVPGSLQRGEEPLCFGECLHPRLRLGHLEQEQSLDRGVGRGHCVAGLVRERLGLLEGRLCGTEIAALLENRTERDQRASAFGVL